MAINTTITSGDSAAIPDASAIAAFLDVSELGAGSVYEFVPGDNVSASLGDGPGTERVLYHLRNGGVRCLYSGAAVTPGTLGSVTKVGTGPTITAALTAGYTAPLNDLSIKVKTTLGGANGTALIAVALDGSTYAYSYTVPQETPAVLLGTVDLTGIVLSTLTATTLIFSAPAAITVTFTLPSSIQDIADQFNTQMIAGVKVQRAEILQTSTGLKKLRIYTTTTGSGVTNTTTAPGTASTLLGFAGAGLTATGGAATLSLPRTGVTLTFPAGTYVAADVYSIPTTGPSASVAALLTAADNLRGWSQTNVKPFGFIAQAAAWNSASNARAWQDAIDARIATWIADPSAPAMAHSLSATTQHTASAVAATNATNVAANDALVIAAYNTPGSIHVSNNTSVHGDGYATGSLIVGKYRQSAALAVIARRAFGKLSQDPGDGALRGLPEWSMVGPDGLTEARDETRATNIVKMGGSTGPGFTVLGTKSGTPRVMRGVTRAGQASRFIDLGVIAPTLRAAQVLHAAAQSIENGTFVTSGGKLTDGERSALNAGLTAQLSANVVEAPFDYFSSASATILSTELIANTRNVTISATLEELGQGENITLKISTIGVVSIAA